MPNAAFAQRFTRYVAEARDARHQDQHHDQRRGIFIEFLTDAFGIQQTDIEIEQYHRLQGQAPQQGRARVRKGWIDAIFRDIIFEFKRNLQRELQDGLRELRDYLRTVEHGAECVGLLTDGLQFDAYVLDESYPDALRKIDSINLETATSEVAYLWLDAYLLSQKQQPPTSKDIVKRFGLTSPTFITAARMLREELAIFAKDAPGELDVKRQQWAFYLARVYGSADARNDDMFVRHTYLCQFAKILAYASLENPAKAAEEIAGVIDGQAFQPMGFGNIGEHDFFAWVLAPTVQAHVRAMFQHIAGSLAVYDLKRIDEDLLKQLYQNLVEPETRHELGEFYTPDWLADLTLQAINFHPGQSLLDPACGSGTFLFTAIRSLVRQGLTGQALVDFALDNIMGVDVHPLAVTIAKVNYMLALARHVQGGRKLRAIPIAMANTLQRPNKVNRIAVISVPFEANRSFEIPLDAANSPEKLNEVLQRMGQFAEQLARSEQPKAALEFGSYAVRELSEEADPASQEIMRLTWNRNVTDLAKAIRDGRDSIWIYVLQNTSRPLILQHSQFDVIAGNPPWLSYRYIQDQSYQKDVKDLTREYGLLAGGDTKGGDTKKNDVNLHTQIELSTLFFEHAWARYLKPGGALAFVMPRSAITGAKQHRAFQRKGFSRVLDLKGVSPLFNVETCVLIRQAGDILTEAIPTTAYAGQLPAHECSLAEAQPHLTANETTTTFAHIEQIASPYYYDRMQNGASLYPRNLVYVTSAQRGLQPGQLANNPIMETDPDLDAEAKVPWKGLKHQGYIDEDFLYATLLSKEMVPFGVQRLRLVALPMRVKDGKFVPLTTDAMRDSITFIDSAQRWFEPVEKIWSEHKKATTKETLAQWLNYQNKITIQSALPGFVLLYSASGSNIASCVLNTVDLPDINGFPPKHIVIDHMHYWYRCLFEQEAHFLAALLNAPCVDAAIKIHQTRGLLGPRHIHRRPFEVCAIPEFDPRDAMHLELAGLSQAAHAEVARVDLAGMGVVAARKKARGAVQAQIDAIDTIARRLLGLAGIPAPVSTNDEDADEDTDLDVLGK